MTSRSTEKRRRVYLVRHGEVDYFDGNGRPCAPDTVPLNPWAVPRRMRLPTALAAGRGHELRADARRHRV
jgi:probable phosphoglycerate mutase